MRATAEELVADTDRLDEVESAKVVLDAGDPRTLELAEEATSLTHEMAAKAGMQEQLVKDSQDPPP